MLSTLGSPEDWIMRYIRTYLIISQNLCSQFEMCAQEMCKNNTNDCLWALFSNTLKLLSIQIHRYKLIRFSHTKNENP